jgi:hypothetical protein
LEKRISRYERVQALIRNPQYLKDYNTKIKGRFNHNDYTKFLQEYGIEIPLDPAQWKAYSQKDIEGTAIFTDDWVIEPIPNEPSEITNLEETPEGFMGVWNLSPHLEHDRFLTVRMDLTAKKKKLLENLEGYIDLYSKHVKKLNTRDKAGSKTDKFKIWDSYKMHTSFAKIAKEFRLEESAVRKAYLNAFSLIMGEKYDPTKHNRKSISPEELSKTCDTCSSRSKCDTPCSDISGYINQDRASLLGVITDSPVLASPEDQDKFD